MIDNTFFKECLESALSGFITDLSNKANVDIEVDDYLWPTIKVEATGYSDAPPEMDIYTMHDEATDTYTFTTSLRFPDLASEDFSYTDSIDYVITEWENFGRAADKLLRLEFRISDYIE